MGVPRARRRPFIRSERTGLEYNSPNFDFSDSGVIFDGKRVAARTLPDYPIRRLETGQWLEGKGRLWNGAITVSERRRTGRRGAIGSGRLLGLGAWCKLVS